MATIERFVGALHGAGKGQPAADVVAGIERYAAALNETRAAPGSRRRWSSTCKSACAASSAAGTRRPTAETMELEW